MSKLNKYTIGILMLCSLLVTLQAQDITVYRTKTGEKYHLSGCRYLSKSMIPISLSGAISMGLGSCGVCHPPVSVGTTRELDSAAGIKPSAKVLVPSEIYGTVTYVYDGDTVQVNDGLHAYKLRIEDIDCPEYDQTFGPQASQYTKKLVMGKNIRVIVSGLDKDGRIVGVVILDGKDLGSILIESGIAWSYTLFNSQSIYPLLEQSAREIGIGLWADPSPTPPWEYRKAKSQ